MKKQHADEDVLLETFMLSFATENYKPPTSVSFNLANMPVQSYEYDSTLY